MGDEEKEDLKKVVEEVGLMEEIKDNNESNNWSLDQYKQALSISNLYYFKVKLEDWVKKLGYMKFKT